MTDTLSTPEWTSPAFTSPRLERPRESAVKGVCTALARTTGTDVVLWRVLAVVLTFFAGLGVFLYLVGIAVIPVEGERQSLAERLLRGPDRRLSGTQVLLVAVLVLALGLVVSDGNGLLALVVLGALALLWWRRQVDSPPLAQPPTPGLYAGSGPTDQGAHAGWVPPSTWSPPPRRPRSPFGGVTVALAVLVTGGLLLLGATDTVDITAEVVLASALGVVGLGLLVGSWWGRSPGLLVLAAALGVALAATVAVHPTLDAGVGGRTWTPVGSASYRLGVGDATLDLRDLEVREAATLGIDARVDVGHLLVIVPDGVRISLDARADLGDVDLFGDETSGHKVSEHLDVGPEGRPQLRLDLSVRTGLVEVRHGT